MGVVAGSSTGLVASLYEAATTGSIANLDALLERCGKEILHRISLTTFAETPLHLAALLGHLEFSGRLLEFIPELALEQDSEKCTPLHLAAAKGHDKVVRELLKGVGEKACLIQDQEGRIPLHLAAMRGRVPVVRELLKSKHGLQTVKMKAGDGDSVLHLCVTYNHLDVLEVVLCSTGEDEDVLKMTDSLGNSVLHLAVMLKHREIVRYLLELPRVRTRVINTSNEMDFTALDVLNHSPKDFKSLEIREMLVAAMETARLHPMLRADRRWNKDGAVGVAEAQEQVDAVKVPAWLKRAWHHVKKLMDYRGDWMNETKGSLMTVTSIIATVTFTAGITPPGGVWQQDTKTSADNFPCNNETVCVAGNAVLAYYYPDKFMAFMKYNMVSFIGSLMVVFLLLSGFPLNNKFCLWFLSLAMCATISFVGLTFLEALWLVVPEELLNRYDKFRSFSIAVWSAMICIVGISLTIRLSSWLLRIYKNPRLRAAWKALSGFFSSKPKLLHVNCCAFCNTRPADTSRC